MLVGAVLTPEGTDDPEFGEGRCAAEHHDEAVVFVGRQAVLGDERRSDGGIARSCGNGHPGVFLAGAVVVGGAVVFAGAGSSFVCLTGIEGVASVGLAGGFICVGAAALAG